MSDSNASGTPGSQIHPPVFFGSAVLIAAFVIFATAAPEFAGNLFTHVQDWVVETFGWYYLLAVTVFLVFSFGLAVSSHGQVKLGPDHAEPYYSYLSWFAMLFSAGMGIGLLSAAGRCSTGAGGWPGHRSSACSSRACRVAARSGSSCSA